MKSGQWTGLGRIRGAKGALMLRKLGYFGTVLALLLSPVALLAQTNWAKLAPAANPGARASHLMTYDSWHQQVVLHGGANSGVLLSDTWIWDGTNWTKQSPGTVPILAKTTAQPSIRSTSAW